jgi:tetratricopeptide (TPR) repeat protein
MLRTVSNSKFLVRSFKDAFKKDIDLALNIYEDLVKEYENFLKLYNVLLRLDILKADAHEWYDNSLALLTQFKGNWRNKCIISSQELSLKLDEANSIAFAEIYEKCKRCKLNLDILSVLKNLNPYANQLKDKETLDETFILNLQTLEVFPWANTNFTYVFINMQKDDAVRKLILLVLHKMYICSKNVYDISIRPDINIEKIEEVILIAIEQMEKQIHGCKNAFKLLKKSLSILRNNFTEYFKDFSATDSETTILESFILDVSKNADANPTIAIEFGRLLNFIRDKQEKLGGNKSPATELIVNTLSKNIDKLQSGDTSTVYLPE